MTRPYQDTETDVFLGVRPRLFAAAYRMLGSVSDAEDILQDVFLRWRAVDQSRVHSMEGYLMRITTRLCLDQLKSARVRRETYPGEWLPEPVLTEDATDLLDHDVTVALLLALDRLSPLERAAFLLHDIFDGAYEDIAAALERSPEACRQLAARARRKVRQPPSKERPSPAQGQALAEAFFHASRTGDMATLTRMLTQDVQLISDGGGKAMAALNPIYGRDKVIRLIQGIGRKFGHGDPHRWRSCRLNGLPAILHWAEDGILQTTSLEFSDGLVSHIYVTRNPDKTAHLAVIFDPS